MLIGEESRLVAQTLAFWPAANPTGPEAWKSSRTLFASTAELRAGWTRTERQIQVAATIEKRDVIEDLLSPARFYHHAATTSRPDTIAGFLLPFHKSRTAGCQISQATNSG